MIKLFDHQVLVEWDKFTPGSSIFIPCVDREDMRKQLKDECRKLGLKAVSKCVIENQTFGVRLWRI